MSVKSWFVGLWTKASGAIARFFEGPGGVVVRQALGATIETVGAVGMSMLLDAARAKVTQLNTMPMENNHKREQALNYLKGYAVQAGLEVGESVLRYTLETAVQAVKGESK